MNCHGFFCDYGCIIACILPIKPIFEENMDFSGFNLIPLYKVSNFSSDYFIMLDFLAFLNIKTRKFNSKKGKNIWNKAKTG